MEASTMQSVQRNKKGGMKTMKFILGSDLCDRFAGYGLSNMINYLTGVLNVPHVEASNILSIFGGTSYGTSLVGALIADTFAGRYWTILVASLIYQLGLLCLTASVIFPQFRPTACPTHANCTEASNVQLWVFYFCLFLMTLGSGGIRPCVVNFAADQLDMAKERTKTKGWNFFNLYNLCMGVAPLVSLTLVFYIQENVSWAWGIGISAIFMAISIVLFVIGSSHYIKVKPAGSPLVRLAQVIVAAARKRTVILPADSRELYQNEELDAGITLTGRLLHSDQFVWFDRAAVVTGTDLATSAQPKLWKIATVQRVEELKSIMRLVPILASGILLIACNSQLGNYTVIQGGTMKRHIFKSFKIPSGSMSIFSNLTVMIGLVSYDRMFIPLVRKFTNKAEGITCLQRMGIGFAIDIFASIVSGLIEIKRKSAIAPISIFWLAPQYCVRGAAEVFLNVGIMEYIYDQSPESMRSTTSALSVIPVSLGSYIGVVLTSVVHKYTGSEGNWLPDNLNRGKLEYFYFLVSGIQVLNLVYFVLCARAYTYKPMEETKNGSEQEMT